MVVAVPLGVLKKGSISFKPPLPARKQGAISRLGFGLLNKVLVSGFRVQGLCTASSCCRQ